MNRWQLFNQMEFLIKAAVWPDAPGGVLFPVNSVKTTGGFDEEDLNEIILPACFLVDGGAVPHQEHPKLKTQIISFFLVAENNNDRFGRGALLGSNRTTTVGQSDNRGLMEIEPHVLAAIGQLGRDEGIRFFLADESETPTRFLGEERGIALKELSYECRMYDEASYQPVSGFSGILAASTVTLTWTQPPSRFDSDGVRIVRKVGSVPTSPTDGTTILDQSALTVLADSPGTGTFGYAAFGVFDELAGQRFSDVGPTAGTFVVP